MHAVPLSSCSSAAHLSPVVFVSGSVNPLSCMTLKRYDVEVDDSYFPILFVSSFPLSFQVKPHFHSQGSCKFRFQCECASDMHVAVDADACDGKRTDRPQKKG